MTEGYGIIPNKIMRMDIQNNTKLLIAYLLSFAGNKNYAFPSLTTMAKDLKMSRSTITSAINDACKNGLLKKEKLYPDNPLKRNNKYVFLFSTMQNTVSSTIESTTVVPSKVPNEYHESTTVVRPKYNSSTENINIINNNRKKKKNLQKSEIEKEKIKELKRLKQNTLLIFKKKSPEQFKTKNDIIRENVAIKKFVEDTYERFDSPGKRDEWICLISGIFSKICDGTTKHKFLNGTVCIPSRMMSKGIWPEVINLVNGKNKQDKTPDYSSYEED